MSTMSREAMFDFGVKLNKDMFFDRAAVKNALRKTNRRFVEKAGIYVKNTAQRSMRYRKKASQPGMPPSAHRKDEKHPHGPLLKIKLFSFYDPYRETAIVGPQALRQSKNPVPAILEFGGTAIVKTRHGPPKRKRRTTKATPEQLAAFKRLLASGRIVHEKVTYTYRPIRVAARPYMLPAMKKELPKFPSLFVKYFGYAAPPMESIPAPNTAGLLTSQ